MNKCVRSITRCLSRWVVTLLAFAWVISHAPLASAQGDSERATRNAQVDTRLGLIERPLRLWKVPVRFKASRSAYFMPGPPPYRQQPEKASSHPLPMPESETPGPPSSVETGSSSSGSSSSPESSATGSSSEGSSSEGVTPSGNGSSGGSAPGDSPDSGPDPGFGPTPTPGTA